MHITRYDVSLCVDQRRNDTTCDSTCNQEQNTSETSSLGSRPLRCFRYIVSSRDISHQNDQTTFPDVTAFMNHYQQEIQISETSTSDP